MKVNNGFVLYKIVIFFAIFIGSCFLLIKIGYEKNADKQKSQQVIEDNGDIGDDAFLENSYQNQNYSETNTVNEYSNYNNEDIEYKEYSYYIVKDNREYFYSQPNSNTIKKAYLVFNEVVYIEQIVNGFGYTEFKNPKGRISSGWVLLKNMDYCPSCEENDNYSTVKVSTEDFSNTDSNKITERQNAVTKSESYEKAQPYEGFGVFSRNYASKFNFLDVGDGVNEISVLLKFVVEKDGSFTDIQVVGPDPHNLGREATRVLKSMPKWRAAEHNGETVRSSFTFPIKIRVNN